MNASMCVHMCVRVCTCVRTVEQLNLTIELLCKRSFTCRSDYRGSNCSLRIMITCAVCSYVIVECWLRQLANSVLATNIENLSK